VLPDDDPAVIHAWSIEQMAAVDRLPTARNATSPRVVEAGSERSLARLRGVYLALARRPVRPIG
jgi:hypothetical protein